MSNDKVGYVVGSLTSTSLNRNHANALVRLAPDGLGMAEIPFDDLPPYDDDYDADGPPAGRALEAIPWVDAALFVTPGYDRSIPGALKNASTREFLQTYMAEFQGFIERVHRAFPKAA